MLNPMFLDSKIINILTYKIYYFFNIIETFYKNIKHE